MCKFLFDLKSASHNMFSAFLVLMVLDRLYCKKYEPRSNCSHRSSLIRVHIVCFSEKIMSEVHLNICSRGKKQTFQFYSWQDNPYRLIYVCSRLTPEALEPNYSLVRQRKHMQTK